MKKILVTGAAGFIGFHTSRRLLEQGYEVVGLDNLNPYYDVNLKKARLELLAQQKKFGFHQVDLANTAEMQRVFREGAFDTVIHLGAQAGVRYSLENPMAYIDSNVVGFTNILENCRHSKVAHLVYASTSSVYGLNAALPFSVQQNVDHPISLYAATKKANELMAHSYSHLFQLPTTGLRFFTVYGPWGRPDMALFLFTKAILEGQPINVFNHGKMKRDFTFVDDIVEGVIRVAARTPAPNSAWDASKPDPSSSSASYRIYNIGNSDPVELMEYIEAIESSLGRKAVKNFLPMQAGDVLSTHADVSSLESDVGFKPTTSIQDGVKRFVSWYRDYYKV